MIEGKKLEYSRYLGGDPMLSILICDDDTSMVAAMRATTESVLRELAAKAKIHTFTDADSISKQILSDCDIALLDIDFDGAEQNGMDIARKLRSLRSDTVIIFVTNFIEYAPAGYEVRAFRYILKRDLQTDLNAILPLALKQLNQETLPIQVNGEIIKVPLLSLIRTANQNPNRRLILNSRISIYQEARDRSISLVRSYEKREYRAYVLDMEQLSAEEKARIFYNHLFFYGVPPQYFESLKVDKKYRAIVKHKNYNPRIIEFVCTPHQYEKISPSKYADFILDCLNNPEQIWKNEYERRLAEVDRLLLTTLYSLSDTSVPFDMVKECFENRITRHASFDKSINHFNQALNRLTGSMIKIVDVRGVRGLAAANPSVNDFIRAHLESNGPERQDLLLTASSIRQFKRILGVISFEEQMSKSFVDHSVLSYVFENNSQKTGFIAVWCAKNKIYDAVYGPYIVDFLYNIRDVNMYESEIEKISNIAKYLFEKEFCLFYGINEVSFELPRFYKMLDELQLDEIVQIVSHIDWIIEQTKRSAYIKEIRAILRENIEAYCTDVPADAYDINIADIVEECHYTDERGGKLDGDEATSMVEQKIEDCVSDELFDILSALPDDIDPQNNLSSNVKISINGAESAVLDYLRDDYDEDMFFEDRENQYMDDKLLDSIFNR